MSEQLTESLKALLGERGLAALAHAFAGTRLYVPKTIDDCHPIAKAVGLDGANRLVRRYEGATIRVPLARTLRARHYRADGWSNARIAVQLGMTEPGVEQLFARLDAPPQKGSAQLPLFP